MQWGKEVGRKTHLGLWEVEAPRCPASLPCQVLDPLPTEWTAEGVGEQAQEQR